MTHRLKCTTWQIKEYIQCLFGVVNSVPALPHRPLTYTRKWQIGRSGQDGVGRKKRTGRREQDGAVRRERTRPGNCGKEGSSSGRAGTSPSGTSSQADCLVTKIVAHPGGTTFHPSCCYPSFRFSWEECHYGGSFRMMPSPVLINCHSKHHLSKWSI